MKYARCYHVSGAANHSAKLPRRSGCARGWFGSLFWRNRSPRDRHRQPHLLLGQSPQCLPRLSHRPDQRHPPRRIHRTPLSRAHRQQINNLAPDLVLLTGDFITHGALHIYRGYARHPPLCRNSLRSRLPTATPSWATTTLLSTVSWSPGPSRPTAPPFSSTNTPPSSALAAVSGSPAWMTPAQAART